MAYGLRLILRSDVSVLFKVNELHYDAESLCGSKLYQSVELGLENHAVKLKWSCDHSDLGCCDTVAEAEM